MRDRGVTSVLHFVTEEESAAAWDRRRATGLVSGGLKALTHELKSGVKLSGQSWDPPLSACAEGRPKGGSVKS